MNEGMKAMGKAARWSRNLWRALGSTKLALVLLAVVLLVSLLASLFPQMPTSPTAREPWLSAVALRYGNATGLLHRLGLFEVYRSPWFWALLALLVLNTLACTVQRLPRLWRALTQPPEVVRPDPFYRGFAHRAECPVTSLGDGLLAAQGVLVRHRYRTYFERNREATLAHISAERRRRAAGATAIGHLAALLLALVVLARPALSWQESGVVLPPGEAQVVGQGPKLMMAAGDLEIDTHPGGQPRNYRVPLTVQIGDSPAVTRTVTINRPLTYRGVAFHLQSFGPAVRLVAPKAEHGLAFTGSQAQEVALAEGGPTLRVALQPEEERLYVEAFDGGGDILGSGYVLDGQQIEVQGTPVTFSLGRYTVWQVSHDPTFALALGAAALLLAAMVISLWVSHRRLWLRIDGRSLQMVGLGDFDGEFDTLADELAEACEPDEELPTPEPLPALKLGSVEGVSGG